MPSLLISQRVGAKFVDALGDIGIHINLQRIEFSFGHKKELLVRRFILGLNQYSYSGTRPAAATSTCLTLENLPKLSSPRSINGCTSLANWSAVRSFAA